MLSRAGGLKALPADGVTERTVTLELRDFEERLVGRGGHLVEVATVAVVAVAISRSRRLAYA